MSDTFKGLMVILEEDHKNSDRQKFINAIKLMNGVVDVQAIDSEGFHDILIKNRTLTAVKTAVISVLNDIGSNKIKLSD